MVVIKRDGREVPFDSGKISGAIIKAFNNVYANNLTGEMVEFANKVADEIGARGDHSRVEDIQNTVVKRLMSSKYKEVATAYVEYRHLHEMARSQYAELMDAVADKLQAKNVKNQNANVDEHSFGGRIGEASDVVNKRYALEYLVSPMAKANHENNEIYIHDLNAYAVGNHNCYLKTTRFITSDGIKSFESFSDGDSVTVLTKDGLWRDATVRFYGNQPMYEITMVRAGVEKTVVATRNHRWVLANGTVTDNLQVGDMLYPLQKMKALQIDTRRNAEMFAFGFILGDGYDHKGFVEAKFCSSAKEAYIDIFDMAGYHIGVSNGFKYARKKTDVSKQDFLSHKMWRVLSLEDKRHLFEGYLAADGSKTTNTKYVWTSDERLCQLIEEISALDGYHIFKKRTKNSDTEYKKDRTLHEYVLTTSYSRNTTWKITSIAKGEHRNKSYEAWCVEEPETHTFTLDGGVVTGNCLSIPFDDLLANGFNTRQTDVRPAQSINTAFQLVAVIFQLQSLQQFGGVSATHLDWTMVPYVRKSFYKHYMDGVRYVENYKGAGTELFHKDLPIDAKEYSHFPKTYDYAMAMTKRECYQAVEGMYHNLSKIGRPCSNVWNLAI